jgi:riboflavin synthase
MFTGIVEAVGQVESIARAEPEHAVVRLVVTTELDVASLAQGASIAVDGVCLTVVERGPGRFAADLGPETLALTALGGLEPGAPVHLERPLRMGDPLGGHLVAGHVDGIGTVVARRARGGSLELDISAPATVARFTATKGSIAVDGVSLTINGVAGDVFTVTLIPHTLSATKLGDKVPGSLVNLEADLIAKHIDRLMEPYLGTERGAAGHTPRREISVEMLRRYGLVR